LPTVHVDATVSCVVHPLTPPVDLVVVGSGILGLAHAAAAADRGLSVLVLERDERPVGASVRNFGHLCLTAQSGTALQYARSSRPVWLSLGAQAGFTVEQSGTVVVARSALEMAVLEDFRAARSSEEVELLTADATRGYVPALDPDAVGGALLPRDLRVDPRQVPGALVDWLSGRGVQFRFGLPVTSVSSGEVTTPEGVVRARYTVVCVGHDVDRLFPTLARDAALTRCRLEMLQVRPSRPVIIRPAVLTGLSMLRYAGIAASPQIGDLRRQIQERTPELLAVDMNLMLTQRPDGDLVIGDTHDYAVTHDPFIDDRVSLLVLGQARRLLGGLDLTVTRRWQGVYAFSTAGDFLDHEIAPDVRVVSVTTGIGMTTSHGLAEAVVESMTSAS